MAKKANLGLGLKVVTNLLFVKQKKNQEKLHASMKFVGNNPVSRFIAFTLAKFQH